MEIRKKINITLKDYFLFNLGMIKNFLLTYSVILFVICVCFNGIVNGFEMNKLSFWLMCLMFFGLGLLVLILYFGSTLFIKSKRLYNVNKQYLVNMEIVFNDDGISQYSDGAESSITYKEIFKVKEGLRSFKIFVNARQGFLIPKRDLTPEAIVDIRNLLNSKTGV